MSDPVDRPGPPAARGPYPPPGTGRGDHGPRQSGPSRREGGVPDGLLLALIGLLLGVTVLVWTGTGLAALVERGRWPTGLHFTRTPVAIRQLATRPGDITAAWPQVAHGDLPRPGLFWGVLVGEVLVLLVLLVFAIGTVARYRALRAARRADRDRGRAAPHWPRTAPDAAGPPGASDTAASAALRSAGPAGAPDGSGTPWSAAPATRSRPPGGSAGLPGSGIEAAPDRPAVHARPVPPGPPVPPDAAVPREPAPAAPDPLTAPRTGSRVLFTGAGAGRTAKGPRAVWPAVLDAVGAVLVTCAGDATWQRTAAARAAIGPVRVFDPEHLVDTTERMRWAPHSGCEDPATAASRSRALLAPMRTHDVTADDAAATLLRCWLHAAAVDGRPFRQLHRWASGSGSGDALRVLRTARDAAAGWSGELDATLHAHPERRDTALDTVRRALSGLSSLHIRDACGPGRSDVLDLESFARERGTLYIVGAPREDPRTDPGAMPMLTALASSVVEHGRRMAAGSSPGRLDPPVTCVLDDVATVAPLPELPALMSEGPALGMPVLAVLRSEEQARHRWPSRDVRALWQNADHRVDL